MRGRRKRLPYQRWRSSKRDLRGRGRAWQGGAVLTPKLWRDGRIYGAYAEEIKSISCIIQGKEHSVKELLVLVKNSR